MGFKVYTSTTADGSMKSLDPSDEMEIAANRAAFLQKNNLAPNDTTWLRLTYGGTDYRRYATLDDSARGDGITRESTYDCDAMVVTQPGHALLLPLADCVGAVLYDPSRHILMVSHLGRHNLEQFGGTHSVNYLVQSHKVDPKNLQVWLSPAAGPGNYPLFAFDNRSLHDVAVEQLLAAGVEQANIDVSPVDSSTDPAYFSHSQFLQGNRAVDGRFAIVAVMEA